MKENKDLSRIIPNSPIYTKYEGICNVCKRGYYPGELISPFFNWDNNYWRHTACLQLFLLTLQYSGHCNDCNEELTPNSQGYWSKHNGVWCVPCGEKLFPKVSVASSRDQEAYIEEIRKTG